MLGCCSLPGYSSYSDHLGDQNSDLTITITDSYGIYIVKGSKYKRWNILLTYLFLISLWLDLNTAETPAVFSNYFEINVNIILKLIIVLSRQIRLIK